MLKLLVTTTASVASFALACVLAAPASAQDSSANPYWGGWYVGAARTQDSAKLATDAVVVTRSLSIFRLLAS